MINRIEKERQENPQLWQISWSMKEFFISVRQYCHIVFVVWLVFSQQMRTAAGTTK